MVNTRICSSEALKSSARGIRFQLQLNGETYPAFVIRYRGKAYAYLNECAHQALELDWNPGEFFDLSGDLIICATHGACYDPVNGLCVAGPCVGAHLTTVAVEERQGKIWLADECYRFAGVEED